MSALDVVCFALSAATTYWYMTSQLWMLNNLLACVFAVHVLQSYLIDSFKNGMLLLVLLFAYDAYWVFNTEVMTAVAQSLQLPVKLLFPREPAVLRGAGGGSFTLLGLGDVILPGVFVVLMLRYEFVGEFVARREKRERGEEESKRDPAAELEDMAVTCKKGFFYSALFGYFTGLLLTLIGFFVFQKGQPALFYINPCMLLFVMTHTTSAATP